MSRGPPIYPHTPKARQEAIARHLKSNKKQLLERCHQALRKRPKARTGQELQLIVDFTATNNFFKDKFDHVGDPFHIELCRRIRHRKSKYNDVIIQQGEIGDEFYIIISGKIRIELVKTTLLGVKQTPQVLVTLGEGDSFGELALLNEEPRAASCIVASLQCELMVIKKEDFVEILQKSHVETLLNRTRFLRKIPLFRTLNRNKLAVVASHMAKRPFGRHQIIIKEGDHAEGMFIITKGTCLVFKKCDQQLLQLNVLQKGDIFGELGVILPGAKRTASVVANATKTECLELSRNDFFESLAQYQELMLDECLSRYPTNARIVEELQNYQQWRNYKRNLLLGECGLQGNQLNNNNNDAFQTQQHHQVPVRPPTGSLRGRNGMDAISKIRKQRQKKQRKKESAPATEYSTERIKKEEEDDEAEKNLTEMRRATRRSSLVDTSASANQQKNAGSHAFTHVLRHSVAQRFGRRLSMSEK